MPFGSDLLFAAADVDGLVVHVEVCEDMFVPIPPSAEAALAGATVLANLSGSPITVGRADDRQLLARSASARCSAAYVYAAAGDGESTTEVSWDGQTSIHENGALLAETERFPAGERHAVADVDLRLLRSERLRMGTFDDNRRHREQTASRRSAPWSSPSTRRPATSGSGATSSASRSCRPTPPVSSRTASRPTTSRSPASCSGCGRSATPRSSSGSPGGLDSTHALIVAARAMDRAGRPRSDILAFTLPGFATGERTKSNAQRLSEALGVTFETIDITETARLMLRELGHPFSSGEPVYDVTFENVQAGLRTDYLFRAANQRGGIVVGTGDLSEAALGWSTYGVGDQMSHYTVNTGVPKTLVQHLIRWVISSEQFDDDVAEVLSDVLDTEISPELVPADSDQEIQSSEQKIGPYNLQDFTLYWVLRYGFRPSRIAFLAWHAWHDLDAGSWPPGFPEGDREAYDLAEIRQWLQVFAQRFFGFAQFKRSAMPNGPKVVAGGSLSPRGDWRAPSDSSATIWLDEIEAHVPES